MAAAPDYLVLGHLTRDLTPEGPQPGGTVYYASWAARLLGKRAAVVTSAAPAETESLRRRGVGVHLIPSPRSTTFENRYGEAGREQWVHAVASPIASQDVPLPWRQAAVVHLGPVAGEVAEGLAALFPRSLLGATLQGWLRAWDETGRVRYRRWRGLGKMWPTLKAAVVSDEDLEGKSRRASRRAARVPILVLTRGKQGAWLYLKGKRTPVPAFPAPKRPATGAGDVFAAAFFIRLQETRQPEAAARFAAAAAALFVGHGRPPARRDVEELLAQ